MIRHGISEFDDYVGYTLLKGDFAVAESRVMLSLNRPQPYDYGLWRDIKYLERAQHKLIDDKNTIRFINNIVSYLRSYVEYTAIDSDNHWDDGHSNINAAIYLSPDILDDIQDDIARLRDTLLWYTEPDTTTHLHIDINDEGEKNIIITVQNHVRHVSMDDEENGLLEIENNKKDEEHDD